jgi:hypothetical protein
MQPKRQDGRLQGKRDNYYERVRERCGPANRSLYIWQLLKLRDLLEEGTIDGGKKCELDEIENSFLTVPVPNILQ